MENGQSIPYSLSNLQDRGKFFVDPSEEIYEGQVVGEHSRANDLVVNITKTKKLSNIELIIYLWVFGMYLVEIEQIKKIGFSKYVSDEWNKFDVILLGNYIKL